MKQKHLLLILLMAFLPWLASAHTYGNEENSEILNSEEITTGSWNVAFTIPTATVASLKVGDAITVKVTDKGSNQWAQLNIDTKSENDDRKDAYNVVVLVNNKLYNMSSFPQELTYTISEKDLTAIHEKNSLYLSGTAGVKFTEVKLTRYVDPTATTKTLAMTTTLYEGTTALSNWTQNYSQPASIINSLQEGDILSVTVGATSGTNCQLRIAWGSSTGAFVAWTGLQNTSMPNDYVLTLTAEQVAAIKAANKLYLNGCNITVSRWTLTQHKTISIERGNASKTVWTGTTLIDWNNNGYETLDAGLFSTATKGMKLRLNFSNMKMGAQGRIVKNDWTAFADADTYEKLPTAWGDYYEYTLTDNMVTALKSDGCHISGVGYTLTSVELIDPMREYVVSATFDTADIKAWETADGTPHLTVTLTNYEEQEVTTTVSATLMTDMFEDFNNYSQNVTLAAGETKTIDLELTELVPGFYRMTAKANNNTICTYVIGYDPTNIVSPNDAQPDFWHFWDTWKTRLAAIPMEITKELLTEYSTGERNIYEVSMKSTPNTVGGEPVTIWGYYAEPKAEGSYPCRINFHGTDNGSSTPPVPATDKNTGWCEYNFSARGQMLSRIKEGNAYTVNGNTDFYAYGLGDNDQHYYRMAYLDCVRAVDFVFSQEKVDKHNVFAAGGSQGGCFTYVCAALNDGRIRAIAPHITGHADFVHTMEIVTWPTNVFNNWINTQVETGNYADYAEGKAALLRHQSYFDTKNFSSRITCPVITNFSLQDQTDGPHLNIAPYNLLEHVADEDKAYSINQFKGHASADNWEHTYMAFFQKYIDAGAKQKTFFLNGGSDGWATLCLDFNAEVPAETKVYTVTAKDETENYLTLRAFETGTILPANMAVIVKTEALADQLFAETSSTGTDMGDNLLQGVTERTAISTLNSGNGIMVLAKKNNNIGFYSTTASYLPAHRAYLKKTASSAPGYTFNFSDDMTTGIGDSVTTHAEQQGTAHFYNLAGQHVAQPKGGLYVINGKKIVIK